MEYEIIVVGGGHAGCEAALASSRMGHKTLLITSNIDNIADTPCNPSIGGPAKGIVVREIDALGGEMGKNTDKSLLQIKKLNTKKGPAVWAIRAQIDKVEYPRNMIETLNKQENLTIIESMVEDLIINNNKIKGIILNNKEEITSCAVILTTGTYLKANILRGSEKTISGPHGEKTSLYLSDNLKKLGFTIQRLKTGTPPRVEKNTIDYSKSLIQPGDKTKIYFSHLEKSYYKLNEQEACHLIYTSPYTHQLVQENLSKSSMYGGHVEGIGARYCPSIEDKIVKFSDKERHQLFLEPESRHYNDIYIQGFSTSMPIEIQEKLVHSLPGLEKAKILKYAYAIEYDAIDPTQLKQTLETKIIDNLYTAGQINGTSGYEEAACQGLVAGINASRKLENATPLILRRDEAYIGVLIDDLVTKGTQEPYRLLTSRAEYRLLLRNDNADLRISKYGYKIGLLNKEQYNKLKDREKKIKLLIKELKKFYLTPKKSSNEFLIKHKSQIIKDRISLYNLLKRPEIKIKNLKDYLNIKKYSKDVLEEVEIMIKYEGYIKKQEREAKKMQEYEEIKIPESIDYSNMINIALEAKEKLNKIKPSSLGQAMRISGVNPADITILMIALKKIKKEAIHE